MYYNSITNKKYSLTFRISIVTESRFYLFILLRLRHQQTRDLYPTNYFRTDISMNFIVLIITSPITFPDLGTTLLKFLIFQGFSM